MVIQDVQSTVSLPEVLNRLHTRVYMGSSHSFLEVMSSVFALLQWTALPGLDTHNDESRTKKATAAETPPSSHLDEMAMQMHKIRMKRRTFSRKVSDDVFVDEL